jgi:hypothetical protein
MAARDALQRFMADNTPPSGRKWADILVIFASVASLGNAIWGPAIFTTAARDPSGADPGIGYNWLAFGLSGLLGILAIIMTMKWPRFARIPLGIAGLLLVVVPFTYTRPYMLPIAMSVVLGLLMLGATPFFGPMPARRKGTV